MSTVVFLGDSLTWGGYGGNYVQVIAERLPQHEVVNAGVGGDTVVNLLARLERVLSEHTPDAVFVMVGGNDAVSYAMPDVRLYYRTTKQVPGGIVTPEAFGQTYHALLERILQQRVQALVGLPPTEYNAELVALRHTYNQQARDAAAAWDVPVLDLARDFIPAQPIERGAVTMAFLREIGERGRTGWSDYEEERRKYGYTYTFDGMHLTPESARLFADRIVPFITPYL